MRNHGSILCTAISILIGIAPLPALAQTNRTADRDPCGYPDTTAPEYRIAALSNWGYGYDSLLADIGRWKANPFIHIDTAGLSVLGRTLFVLTIQDTAAPVAPRKRVWIHARTHPNEVQGTWVTNSMIALLLSDTPLGRSLRDSCVFCILPMYNPDGVELGLARENAHNIDIESNWAVLPGEPEVQALRARFTALMATSNPIQLALNVHSAYDCKRYFVFHAATGTSAAYAAMEQRLINGARSAFPRGFQPWDYMVTWATVASTVYPESWFWYNFHEAVLALTYEDMNCPQAGSYDSTAFALLSGIKQYLFTPGTSVAERDHPQQVQLLRNYPNPFNPVTQISYTVAESRENGLGRMEVKLVVYDLLGREVTTLVDELKTRGTYTVSWDASTRASGTYIAWLTVGSTRTAVQMALIR